MMNPADRAWNPRVSPDPAWSATRGVHVVILASLFVAYACMACGGGSGTRGPDDMAGDLGAGDVAEAIHADLTGPDDPGADSGGADRSSETEVHADVVDGEYPPSLKGFLDPCVENPECASGFCVTHAGAKVCTEICLESCPAGWKCREVTGTGGDVTFLCISDFWGLCRPCRSNEDCEGPGGAAEECVRYGEDGYYCGAACKTGGDCPDGYECVEATGASGGVTLQCMAKTRQCACTGLYVKLGLKTQCSKTNDWGTCWGERTCAWTGSGGLTPCSASPASAEVCDGFDNDCDGQKDEGLPDCCVCGNHKQEPFCGESVVNCPADFTACGDGKCEPGESPLECPVDCCGSCGDGLCKGFACGEDVKTCPQDCDAVCGNGKCEYGEGPASCVQDCKWDVCGNQVCEPGDGGPTGCPEDCANACGDCTCDPDEDWQTCPIDCGYCGDRVCSKCPDRLEDETNCPQDCKMGVEMCNGLDDDEDGQTDEEDAAGCSLHYYDHDGDGFGASLAPRCLCGPEPPYSAATAGDCDDSDTTRYPGAPEVCDGKDNACDGVTDPTGAVGCKETYKDADGDGYGNVNKPVLCLCKPDQVPDYTASAGGDCDDSDAGIHPGAFEACNGRDDDCDGDADEDQGTTTCGLGACEHTVSNCAGGQPKECDPKKGASPEVCDGADNDCDGLTDAEDKADIDPNGYFVADHPPCEKHTGVCEWASHLAEQCVGGEWQTCTDAWYKKLSILYDGTAEIRCDGLDNDCDGEIDEDFDVIGADGTPYHGIGVPCGVGSCAGGVTACEGLQAVHCPTFSSATPELCNGLDDDCDGGTDEGGGLLCDDGIDCTTDLCEGNSGCASKLITGWCLVDGDCRSEGLTRPLYPCQACITTKSVSEWTNLPDGTTCHSTYVPDGHCLEGACVGKLAPGATCGDDSDCTTGRCDGVCCAASVGCPTCQSCGLGTGQCVPVSEDLKCIGPGTCGCCSESLVFFPPACRNGTCRPCAQPSAIGCLNSCIVFCGRLCSEPTKCENPVGCL